MTWVAKVLSVFLLFNGSHSLDLSCDPGWQARPGSASCMQFVDGQATIAGWHDAEVHCQRLGGSLLVINDEQERDYATRVAGETSHENTWWVGVYFDEEASAYKWVSGDPIDPAITPWDGGSAPEPNNTVCGELRQNAHLGVRTCTTAQRYICEKVLGAKISCDVGWTEYGEKCYMALEGDKNFNEGNTQCGDQGGKLVVPNDSNENRFVWDIALLLNANVWLGIRENASNAGQWYWTDGSDGSYTNWEGEDNPVSHDGAGAAFIALDTGKWGTMVDTSKMRAICERDTGSFCQFDMVPREEKCYDFNLDTSTLYDWIEDKARCAQYGMKLMTIESSEEDEWVNLELYKTGLFSGSESNVDGVWLGFSETDVHSVKFLSETTGEIVGETEGIYDGRLPELSYNEQEKDCLYMRVCGGDDACDFPSEAGTRWRNNNCSVVSAVNTQIYACQNPIGEQVNIGDAIHPAVSCPTGWSENFAGNCYLLVTEELNWGAARAFCKDNNTDSDLASLLTQVENSHVTSLVAAVGGEMDWWMGFNDRLTEGDFQWSDGSPVHYDNWEEGEPNHHDDKENCGEFKSSFGYNWNDDDCSELQPFVCKVKASVDPDNPVIDDGGTTPEPNPHCHESSGWVYDDDTGMCYHMIPEPMSWSDAITECEYRGGHRNGGNLASVNSYDEYRFLDDLMLDGNHEAHWIGLNNMNEVGSYQWSDGTPMTFTNWRNGEPNNENDIENCVEMVASDGSTWNDMPCNYTRGAICEKRATTYQYPPGPPEPELTCPDGWDGGLDRCYYFSISHESTAANWTMANDMCRGMDGAASLTLIKSESENTFIKERIGNQTTYLGATDADEEGVFRWVEDNSVVSDSYTNWVPEKPDGGEAENCMVMLGDAATWEDVSCVPEAETPMNFVCSKPNVVCPSHWHYYNGNCYSYSFDSDPVDHGTAVSLCQEGHSKATLATIFSSEENWYVNRYMRYADATTAFIGLRKKADTENDWEWMDGSEVGYTKWVEGEPDVVEGQDCGGMNKEDGTWFSAACTATKSYHCKLQPEYYRGCQPGWEKWNGNCYMMQFEQSTWEEAEVSCRSRGGDLVSILSPEENAFVDTLIQEDGGCPATEHGSWVIDDDGTCLMFVDELTLWETANQRCNDAGGSLAIIKDDKKNTFIMNQIQGRWWYTGWIGGVRNGSDFIWPDGTIVGADGYDNWADGQPDNTGDVEDCMDIIGDANTFVPFGTWNDQNCSITAPYICERQQDPVKKKEKWIGLADLDEDNTFEWSDGNAVLMTNWGTNEPVRYQGDKKACVMYEETTNWVLADCDTTYSSVCKRPEEIVPTSQTPDGCSEGQEALDGSCYELVHDYRTFDAANNDCLDKGGHLVIIESQVEQDKITSFVAEHRMHYQIGLHYDTSLYSHVWVDGSYLQNFDNWASGEPSTSTDENGNGMCVKMWDHDYIGQWYERPCTEPAAYICEYPRAGHTNPDPTTTPQPSGNCIDYLWQEINARCYYGPSGQKSFAQAEADCNLYGAHLVSINSPEEQEAVESLARYAEEWIGLRESEGEGGYEWLDGTVTGHTDWQDGYPEAAAEHENCVIDANEFTGDGWKPVDCDAFYGYTCEMAAGATAPPPTEPIPPPAQAPCEGFEDWVSMEGGDSSVCYLAKDDAKTWDEAYQECINLGGLLTSAHSNQENAFANSLLVNDHYWIGLYKNTHDSPFTWVDNSVLDYEKWMDLEPNDSGGMESCVSMSMYNGGLWNDDHCQKTRGFVCKMTQGATVPPATTPMPTRNCLEGFSKFNGHCYMLVGSHDPYQRQTFDYANTQCKSYDSRSHLVGVHDIYEMAFVTTLVADTTMHEQIDVFWIGLKETDNGFLWVDQSPVDYTNWAAEEPAPSPSYTESCAQMHGIRSTDQTGMWSSVGCESWYPFICKTPAIYDTSDPDPVMCEHEGKTDWNAFYGSCYHHEATAKTWADADQFCKDRGAHLVSIQDIAEQSYMLNYFTEDDNWIGLNNIGDHNTFNWVNGWPLTYTNWNGTQPPDSPTTDLCVRYNRAQGKWFTESCDNTYHFACKYTPGDPPTVPPHFGNCPEGDWTDVEGPKCYYVSNSDPLNGKSWSDALLDCEGRGGTLASIESAAENGRVYTEVSKGSIAVWIGLSLSEDGTTWTWTDGSPYGYTNWYNGEPNGGGGFGNEECAQMYENSGYWNDFDCATAYGYVCQADKDAVTNPPPLGSTNEPPATNPATDNPPPNSSPGNGDGGSDGGGGGLSGGATAAIVIVVLLLVGGAGAGFVIYRKKDLIRMRQFSYGRHRENNSGGVVNETYAEGGGSAASAT